MLQDTIERFFVDNLYADIERGLFLVRGENVLLLGEIVRLACIFYLIPAKKLTQHTGPGQG